MFRALLSVLLTAILMASLTGALPAQDSRENTNQEGTTVAQSLADKLRGSPNSVPALNAYAAAVSREVNTLQGDPAKTLKKLDEIEEFLNQLKATSPTAKRSIATFKQNIDTKRASLAAQGSGGGAPNTVDVIGKSAPPLNVDAWVNGTPLTDKDLRGKVVLLDFWAVWCGPCIATFPHLREWQEKYGEKGLVIVGLTNYYNFTWDAAANKAARATGDVKPSDEREMLVKFAQSHNLKHRFAIQSDRSLSQFYGVTGIPHAVVIDQEGKVRLMKTGSGEANAKAIDDLLASLLGGSAGSE